MNQPDNAPGHRGFPSTAGRNPAIFHPAPAASAVPGKVALGGDLGL